MDAFKPFLGIGLKNYAEYQVGETPQREGAVAMVTGVFTVCFVLQVCLAAVGLVCDLCRALQSNMLPYCDEIMQLLLENLGVRKTPFVILCCYSRVSVLLLDALTPLSPVSSE